MGLTLILDADVENYYCSSTSSSGFKVLVHSPIEIPRIANFGFFVATGRETKVVITPKITQASYVIQKISVDKRQCIFENEANLTYYKIYSRKNCEMECSSKLTESNCGCTLYYMPRKFDNDSMICNRKKAPCYETVLYNIALTYNVKYSCNHCLPACFEINYEREISSSKLGTGEFITRDKIVNRNSSYVRRNVAIVHIFFLDSSYGGYTKTEFIGFTDFLSNIGGLLGLFMGFSVISLVEIVYFLSFRHYFVRKRNRKQKEKDNVDPPMPNQNRIFKVNVPGPLYYNKKISSWEVSKKKTVGQKLKKSVKTGFNSAGGKASSPWKNVSGLFKKEEEAPFPYCN